MLLATPVVFAQHGEIFAGDTCAYFYATGPLTYVSPGIPLDVSYFYWALDSACRAKTRWEIADSLDKVTSLDSLRLFYKYLARAIDYDALLYLRMRHEYSTAGLFPEVRPTYKTNIATALGFVGQRYHALTEEDTSLAALISHGVIGIYKVRVRDVTLTKVTGQQTWLGTPADTTYRYHARCTILERLFGQGVIRNCCQTNYTEDDCIAMNWAADAPNEIWEYDSLRTDELLLPDRVYYVFLNYWPSDNFTTKTSRYSICPIQLDDHIMAFPLENGVVIDTGNHFGMGNVVAEVEFHSRMEAMIHVIIKE